MTVTNLEARARDLRTQLKLVEQGIAAEAAAAAARTEDKELGIELHSRLCHWNHNDGCSWFYSPEDWAEHSHGKYLAMAQKMLEVTDLATAKSLTECLGPVIAK